MICMNRRSNQRRENVRRVLVYTLMALTVITTVAILVPIISGYRYDIKSGRVEQSSILQFQSTPSGATVEVDGTVLSSKTSTKTTVFSGSHFVVMWLDGYETWYKTVDIRAGSLLWLDYVRFVPKDRTVQTVNTYKNIYASSTSPNSRYILIQSDASLPQFDLVDTNNDKADTVSLTIPPDVYSKTDTDDTVHNFQIGSWSKNGRYVLIKHSYGDKVEWLSMDTHDPNVSNNITRMMDVAIDSIYYSGNSGNILYALINGDVRKIDLSSETLSRALVNDVEKFSIYEDSDILAYVSKYDSQKNVRTVGLYKDNYSTPYILSTVSGDASLLVATAHYYNRDYVAIAENSVVNILSGKYPSSGESSDSMTIDDSFRLDSDIRYLSFSPSGDYVLAQAGGQFGGYSLEQSSLEKADLEGDGDIPRLKWLDDNHLWSDRDGVLKMREFDGANTSTVTDSVVSGQTVTLSPNERYIYSIGKNDSGQYQLQRVRMILP